MSLCLPRPLKIEAFYTLKIIASCRFLSSQKRYIFKASSWNYGSVLRESKAATMSEVVTPLTAQSPCVLCRGPRGSFHRRPTLLLRVSSHCDEGRAAGHDSGCQFQAQELRDIALLTSSRHREERVLQRVCSSRRKERPRHTRETEACPRAALSPAPRGSTAPTNHRRTGGRRTLTALCPCVPG